MCVLKWKQGEFAMLSEPKIERRKKQHCAAIQMNGRTELYFSDPAIEKDPKKFKTELLFLIKD